MKKYRWYDAIGVNLFWLGLNIRNNAVQAIFMPYLIAIYAAPEVRNTALGGMRTAGLIIAMLAQPAMGLLSDRNTSRYGRRRPFIFAGVLLDLLFLALIALASNYWTLLAAVLLIQLSSNISHGALQALIPDLVPEENRGVASAVKAIFELLPLIVLGLTIGPMVGRGQFYPAVWVTGAALLLIMLLTMLLVKETPLEKKPSEPIAPAMLRVLGMLGGIAAGAAAGLAAGALVGGVAALIALPFRGSPFALNVLVGVGGVAAMAVAAGAAAIFGTRFTLGKTAAGARSFTWWIVNRLLFMAAVTSIQTFAPYFLMYSFKVDEAQGVAMTSTLVMMVGIFTLLSALPGGWLSDKFGQKRMVALGGVLGAAGVGVVLTTIWLPNLTVLYAGGCVLGLGTGLFVATNWALGTRLVSKEKAGLWMGVSNIAGAGAGILGSGIGGPMADYLNASLPGLGYFAIFAGYGVLFLLSVAVLRLVKPPSKQSK